MGRFDKILRTAKEKCSCRQYNILMLLMLTIECCVGIAKKNTTATFLYNL